MLKYIFSIPPDDASFLQNLRLFLICQVGPAIESTIIFCTVWWYINNHTWMCYLNLSCFCISSSFEPSNDLFTTNDKCEVYRNLHLIFLSCFCIISPFEPSDDLCTTNEKCEVYRNLHFIFLTFLFYLMSEPLYIAYMCDLSNLWASVNVYNWVNKPSCLKKQFAFQILGLY